MKTFILTLVLLLPTLSFAQDCDGQYTEGLVIEAAQRLQELRQPEASLKKDAYSYSSQQNLWAVFFWYSADEKSVWYVTTSPDGCEVVRVSK